MQFIKGLFPMRLSLVLDQVNQRFLIPSR